MSDETERYFVKKPLYWIYERKTQRGTVYDVTFRVIDYNYNTIQKKLSGFATRAEAEGAYINFLATRCDAATDSIIVEKKQKEYAERQAEKRKEAEKHVKRVRDYINEYIDSLGNQNKEATIYEKVRYLQVIAEEYGNKTMDVFTVQELYRWQDRLFAAKNPKTGDYYAYKTSSKRRTFLSAFLSWCETRYGIKNNMAEVKPPKRRASKKRMQFWTQDEFEQFIDVVNDDMWRTFFTILFFTGRRVGEVLALMPENIHGNKIEWLYSVTRKTTDDSTWKLTSTKEDKEHLLPICKRVQDALKAWQPAGKFVFGGDRPMSDNSVRRALADYTDIAGVKKIRVHDLRHSFVSMLIHNGANAQVVAELISDTVEQVYKTYGHLYNSDLLAAVEALG